MGERAVEEEDTGIAPEDVSLRSLVAPFVVKGFIDEDDDACDSCSASLAAAAWQ